jgi:hypothetical protein
LAVPHFKEWLGFAPNLDWASHRMDPLGINLAIQPDKILDQLLGDHADIQDDKQMDTEGLSIRGLLAKIEDVPLGTSLAGFVKHSTYCSNEEAAKILASPDWQAAFNLWSSLPGVNDYHHWISYIWHSSARSAYHQEATNMWLFQSQTKQAKRLHDLSVMVPRSSDTHETQRRYLASQAFCWLAKAAEQAEDFWKTIYADDVERELRCLFATAYHAPDWAEFLDSMRQLERAQEDVLKGMRRLKDAEEGPAIEERAKVEKKGEEVRLGREKLGSIIRRQGWIASHVWTNKGILSEGISLNQNKLVAGFILQLYDVHEGLAPCSVIPSILTQLRALLGDAQSYEPEWIDFLHFIQSYKNAEIQRSMSILVNLEDAKLVREYWKSITVKMHNSPRRPLDAVLVIPRSVSTPSQLETFCQLQHDRLGRVLNAALISEALEAVPLEERFAWRAVTAWKSQHPSPIPLADLESTCAPARLDDQLKYIRTSLQRQAKRTNLLNRLSRLAVGDHRATWVLGPMDMEADVLGSVGAVPDESLEKQANFVFRGLRLGTDQDRPLSPGNLLGQGPPALSPDCLKEGGKTTNFELDAGRSILIRIRSMGYFSLP